MGYSWISSKLAVGDEESLVTLIAAGVTAVVNVAVEIDDDPGDLGDAEYTKVDLVEELPGEDPNDCSLFQEAIDAIYDYLRAGETVYVHSNNGTNRGPAMAALYFHEYRGYTLSGALNFIEFKHSDTDVEETIWQTISDCFPDAEEAECPSVECCKEEVWEDNSGAIQGQLNGLLWVMPCISHDPDCTCVDPADTETVLTGEEDHVYNVVLRIRGIVEDRAGYTGDPVTAIEGTSYCYMDGTTGAPSGRNIYYLDISDPAHRYYLNGVPAGPIGILNVDYSFAVQMRTGATITLHSESVDNVQVPNAGNEEVAVGPGDPPIGVNQPYDGQFLQLDVVTIVS